MRSMLYYPFVQPPRDVLAQGILYWDQIGSIVPSHYELPDSLKMAADHGLYQSLDVTRYVDEVSLDKLTQEVEHLVTSLPAESLRLPRDPVTASTRLYYGKLPWELESRLLERGVLRDRGATMQGAQELLGPLLALLARAVADGESDPTVGWVCHTNVEKAQGIAYTSDADRGVPAWRLQMGSIFKVPAPGTDLAELLDFRERYGDERVELLRAVDRFVAESGGPRAADIIPRIAEEIDYAMTKIEAASKARGIKLRKAVTYGTLAATAGAAVPASEALGAIWGAAAVGAVGVLGSLLTGATQTYLKPEAISPYNYLHRARAEFAI